MECSISVLLMIELVRVTREACSSDKHVCPTDELHIAPEGNHAQKPRQADKTLGNVVLMIIRILGQKMDS